MSETIIIIHKFDIVVYIIGSIACSNGVHLISYAKGKL